MSLDAATGKERWHKEIADVRQQYFCTPAPIVIRNHVIVGVGGDSLDVQGFLESRDPETGDLQWRWYTTPQKLGDAGSDSWPDEYSMTHGGGMTWLPPTYDPELNLLYVPTGNPNPVFAPRSRKGDNLFTCSLVALNPDTGNMMWYFQTSPHDTHDWDSAQVPVLLDGQVDGRPRKLVAQAARNGYYFLIDRTNGKSVLTVPYVDFMNWSLGVNARGQPINNPAKDATVDGVLVAPGSATNWPPPSFSPKTGLLYVGTAQSYGFQYLTDTDERPEGYGGGAVGAGGGGGRRDLPQGDRLPHRQDPLAAPAERGRRDGSVDDGRRSALRRRRLGKLRRLRSLDRRSRVARRPRGKPVECADHLHAGRPAIRGRRRGRQFVRVYPGAMSLIEMFRNCTRLGG